MENPDLHTTGRSSLAVQAIAGRRIELISYPGIQNINANRLTYSSNSRGGITIGHDTSQSTARVLAPLYIYLSENEGKIARAGLVAYDVNYLNDHDLEHRGSKRPPLPHLYTLKNINLARDNARCFRLIAITTADHWLLVGECDTACITSIDFAGEPPRPIALSACTQPLLPRCHLPDPCNCAKVEDKYASTPEEGYFLLTPRANTRTWERHTSSSTTTNDLSVRRETGVSMQPALDKTHRSVSPHSEAKPTNTLGIDDIKPLPVRFGDVNTYAFGHAKRGSLTSHACNDEQWN